MASRATELLAATDGRLVGPERLREPQLRGLAEPFAITLDFGELPVSEPLVLALNGWLRFGGGMANVAGSLDPNLPFPFPSLEAELPDGSWKRVPVRIRVPAGKTKTILVDLEGKLPAGARRLRLTTAFELYWDSVSLCVKASAQQNRVTILRPSRTDLRSRGFSEIRPAARLAAAPPEYERLRDAPPWRRTPYGWCTPVWRRRRPARRKRRRLGPAQWRGRVGAGLRCRTSASRNLKDSSATSSSTWQAGIKTRISTSGKVGRSSRGLFTAWMTRPRAASPGQPTCASVVS